MYYYAYFLFFFFQKKHAEIKIINTYNRNDYKKSKKKLNINKIQNNRNY